MPKYRFNVISEHKYPIETRGNLEVSGWRTAAGRAVAAHLKEMKAKGKSRQIGDKLIVKLFRLPKDIIDIPKDENA